VAYLKPPVFARRVFNPLAMRLRIGGSATLVVTRRTTGEPQRLPVIPVEHDGALHLVSTRGESDWVRNLRAAGGGELDDGSGPTSFRAVELPVEKRDPVLAAYRKRAGRTVDPYFKKLPAAGDHPVFRITSG
jgi:deazaflavin-dependent oxidoreductase (nitroreductase family)